MKVETKIKLNRFKPRPYQAPIIDAIENKGYKRVLAILPRRSGKDITAFNLCIRECIRKVTTIYYIFPTFAQAKRVIWDAVDNSGFRVLDYIPSELIASKNSQEMKIRFTNGSLLSLVGSDNFDALMGTNFSGAVFSEYALQDPRAYQYIRPILTANEGWALFISTPRGKNHLYELYEIARNSPDWFCLKLSVEDTKHIPLEAIEAERRTGEMSEDLIQQEYYCSFTQGVEGSYYAKYIENMYLQHKIGDVPWESSFKVNTAWDLGMRDSTSIIFYQTIGQTVRVIDFYENNKQGLEHYAAILQNKPYQYGKHFAPHDAFSKHLVSGGSIYDKAKNLGIQFEAQRDRHGRLVSAIPNESIIDGIEAVRSLFSKLWIDKENCIQLIKALENYRQEFDHKRRVYKPQPLHDQYSHACFVGETLVSTASGDIEIKHIKPGMFVTTPFGSRKVLGVHSKTTTKLLDVEVNKIKIITTPYHYIFTQRGLVRSDSLRYTDIMEFNSLISRALWKKIYSFYGGAIGLSGFKKSILSLETDHGLSLMGTFLNGMGITLGHPMDQQRFPRYKEPFGRSIKGRFPKDSIFTILMGIPRTTLSRIFYVFQQKTTFLCMQICPGAGPNLKSARQNLDRSMQKRQNGTEAQKGGNGTENMQKRRSQDCAEQNTAYAARNALINLWESRHGSFSALILARVAIEWLVGLIAWIALVVCVKLYSFVINTLLKKHVVKSVQTYAPPEPVRVYDLTVEHDNCYYANGYLVSNSDAARYMALSLPKMSDGRSAEELEKIYQEARYGVQSNMPRIFSGEFNDPYHSF